MAVETLRAMALGGMRDHIGGGFHRYSVDARWRVPHFEKMLYDQAQLVIACLEAAQAAGDGFYASVAEDTLDYVRRELTHEQGGFFSAEDADSVPPEHAGDPAAHATEGAFYIWPQAEVDALFNEEEAHVVAPALRDRAEQGNAPVRSAGRVRHEEPALHRRRASRKSPRAPDSRPTPSSRCWDGQGRCSFARGRSGRARISTTRCSPRGTG